jgi:hypothetical protein
MVGIIDLAKSSDIRFRDIVGRDQYQVVTTGNTLRKIYHTVSGGGLVNTSAVGVVTVVNNNAQFDMVMTTPTVAVSVANITTANIATWSTNSMLAIQRGTTTFRSGNVSVGNLNVSGTLTGNILSFSLPSGSLIQLNNTAIRSFQRTLGSPAGNTASICIMSNKHGAYVVDLHIVQSESGASISKAYQFAVRADATQDAWHRLVPLSSTSSTNWGAEIRVTTTTPSITITTTNLRLVRLSGSTTTNFECTVSVYYSRTDPVSFTSTITQTSGVTFSTILYESSLLTRVGGNVGIGTDSPTALLDVAGKVSVNSLSVTNDIFAGTGVGARSNISDSTVLTQGAYMSWNATDGYTNFVCKRGTGSGGFHFYRSDLSGSTFDSGKLRLATLSTAGIDMPQGAFIAPGSIIGSYFISGTDSAISDGVSITTSLTRASPATGYMTMATFYYTPKNTSSRLSVYFDIDYSMNGFGGDTFFSRITVDNTEVIAKRQQFNSDGTIGKGTRSCTIFPISTIVNNTTTSQRTFRIQVNLNETDDTLTLSSNMWMFKLIETKT